MVSPSKKKGASSPESSSCTPQSKPVHPKQPEWYYQRSQSEIVGPLTADQLLAATVDSSVKSNTLVRRGSEAWQLAKDVKGLFQWHYKSWFKSIGPVTTAQLFALAEKDVVKPDTQVCRVDASWQAASSIKGLFDWYYKGWLKEVGPLLKSRFHQAARAGSIKPETLIRQKDGNWKPASELQGLFEWYYKRKNKDIGPLLMSDLLKAARDGKVQTNTLICKGNGPWNPATEVDGLFEWYYQEKEKIVGPLLTTTFFKAVLDGTIQPDTLVRKGSGLWHSASGMEGFFSKVQQAQAAKAARQIRAFRAALKIMLKLAKMSLEENDRDVLEDGSFESSLDFDDSIFDCGLRTDNFGIESDLDFDISSDFGLDSGYDDGSSFFDNDPGFSTDFGFDAGSGFDSNFDSGSGSDSGFDSGSDSGSSSNC